MDDCKSDSAKLSMLASNNDEEALNHNALEQQQKDDSGSEPADREEPTSREKYKSRNSKGSDDIDKNSQSNVSDGNGNTRLQTLKDGWKSTESNLNFLDHLRKLFKIHSNIIPLEFVFSKIVAVILKSKGYVFTHELQVELTQISSKYFDNLVRSLHNFTEYQRRRKPSLKDLSLCLKDKARCERIV